jgi:hypothetical protein
VQPIVDTAQAASRLRSLASDAARRSRTAVLREVLPEIEKAMRAGVSQVVILEELRTLGFQMTQSGFRSALRRLRTERPQLGGRAGNASMSTEFWSGVETQPAAFTATTTRGSLYDVDALSRLLMASRRTDLEDLRR